MNKLIFKKITFINFKNYELNKILKKNDLFVFQSAPGLASIYSQKKYYDLLIKADFVFFDSSFFVLLLNFLKNLSVVRFSGYKFYLGWFVRLIYNLLFFIKRLIYTHKLINIGESSNCKIIHVNG